MHAADITAGTLHVERGVNLKMLAPYTHPLERVPVLIRLLRKLANENRKLRRLDPKVTRKRRLKIEISGRKVARGGGVEKYT